MKPRVSTAASAAQGEIDASNRDISFLSLKNSLQQSNEVFNHFKSNIASSSGMNSGLAQMPRGIAHPNSSN
jgi:hypothetical protein